MPASEANHPVATHGLRREILVAGDPDRAFSAREFAALFGHGPRWGTQVFRSGAVRTFQINGKGRRYTKRADIQAWIAQMTDGA